MKTIRIIAALVLLIQLGNLVPILLYGGMGHGAGFDTFLAGMHDPWQNFINNDLVMGLVFTLSWVIFRERGAGVLKTIAWVWMAAWWGNIVIAAYVLRAVREAGGDWAVFFQGRHAPGAVLVPGRVLPVAARRVSAVAAVGALAYTGYGLASCGFALIPSVGYAAGFLPVALTLALLARGGDNRPRHPALAGRLGRSSASSAP